MHKFIRNGIIVEIILIMILLLYQYKKTTIEPHSIYSINTTQKSEDYTITDFALINTYLDAIRDATVAFYADKFTIAPTVSSYSVTIQGIKPKEITSPKSHILITFKTKPYLGAHNTIGIDEITFQASYTGNTSLIEYKHIQRFDLPKHLQDLKIVN